MTKSDKKCDSGRPKLYEHLVFSIYAVAAVNPLQYEDLLFDERAST